MFILQEDPIDLARARSSSFKTHTGALTNFEGLVRADKSQGKEVAALLYLADALSCISEGERIIREACEQFNINDAICIQRIGKVQVGESAVWVGAWAGHRDDSFKACRYIIEEVKKRLHIWKKELYTDGSSKWIHGTHAEISL